MLRFPPVGVFACAVAGVALWLTHASMDVATYAGGELRIAMFPSGVELVALVILSLVVALLLSRLLRRLWQRRTPHTTLPVDPVLPLFSLIWLAVPYLPWLPDGVPALRALAGPARYGLWMVVAGQVLWSMWDLRHRPARQVELRTGALMRGTWVVLLIGAAGFGGAAIILARSVSYPAADEAHYLVIAESVARDRDLRLSNNYEAADYRAFYPALLTPEGVAGKSDAYPLRPVGLPILIAPAYAVGGYGGVTILLTLIAAVALACAWRSAAKHSGASGSATFGWLAVSTSAPFVLHACSVRPEIIAAGVAVAALTWTPSAARWNGAALAGQSLLVGVLPWLGLAYLPLWLVLTVIAAARQRRAAALALSTLPSVAFAAGALASFHELWGTLLPTAAIQSTAESPGLALRLPALVADQEYGLLPYAPALILAGPGYAVMWTQSREVRRAALEWGAAVAAIAAASAWAGLELSAHRLVAMLPLLILPIAWWEHSVATQTVLRAAGRVLVLVGVAVTTALVSVDIGLLGMKRSDGSSQLLEWLAPSHDLVRLMPSFVAHEEPPIAALVLTAGWIAAAFVSFAVLRRLHLSRPSVGPPLALAAVLATAVLVAIAATAAMGARLSPRVDPALRMESSLLSRFDARVRPAAIAYDRWRPVPADAVPTLFTFEGRPGRRREPQPVRVLMNTRLSLPAGDYEVELRATTDAAIDGPVGLQVGRLGEPVWSWPAHASNGETWRQRFRLDVDAPFVGFRASSEIERATESVWVRPLSVLNTTERLDRHLGLPPVLAAARYRDVTAYFHGAAAFPERTGFWVRGSAELLATLARDPAAGTLPLRLRLHTGAAANTVHLSAGTWRTTVALQPGEEALVHVPWLQGVHKTALRIVTDTGFVPAATIGGDDRRVLGCWVEIVE